MPYYNKDIFSFQLSNPENISFHKLNLTEEAKQYLGFNDKYKTHKERLTDFLSKKEVDRAVTLLKELIIETISPEQKIKCVYCGINKLSSPHNTAKLCTIFLLEGNLMFNLAAKEFISIIEQNKTLLKKEISKKLTRVFFTCFIIQFGRFYFNLDKLRFACLKEGLASVSELLKDSPTFERFKIINDSTHSLKKQQIFHNLEYSRGNKYVKTQIDWFEEQHRYYKNNQEIEEQYSNTKSINKSKNENYFPHIFKTKKDFEFFEYLLEEFNIEYKFKTKIPISDLTDIYIFLLQDNLLLETFKPAMYINWLNQNYSYISIDRLKEVSTRKPPISKSDRYKNLKQLFYRNKN